MAWMTAWMRSMWLRRRVPASIWLIAPWLRPVSALRSFWLMPVAERRSRKTTPKSHCAKASATAGFAQMDSGTKLERVQAEHRESSL
jgi:hypothetical protein